jgi:hypothetical protein
LGEQISGVFFIGLGLLLAYVSYKVYGKPFVVSKGRYKGQTSVTMSIAWLCSAIFSIVLGLALLLWSTPPH